MSGGEVSPPGGLTSSDFAIMGGVELVTNIIRPGGQPQRVLLLTHGLGSDQNDLAQLIPYLDPHGHFLVVCPRGPLSAPPGAAWYHFGPEGPEAASFLSSLAALDDLLEKVSADEGLPRAQAVVGGFSQGASMAMALGLQRSERARPAAVLGMSGFLPTVAGVDFDLTEPPTVLLQHGTNDPLIPVTAGRAAAETLRSRGVPVVFQEYPMAHQVTLESIEDAAAWLEEVRQGGRPDRAAAPATPPAPPPDEGPVRSVTSATFGREVLESDIPVIVDFWAPWCGPCRQVSPIVEHIARMRQGSYKVVKVNIDENPDIAQTYKVQSIPLIGLFRNGRLERTALGAKPRQQIEAELGMLVIP